MLIHIYLNYQYDSNIFMSHLSDFSIVETEVSNSYKKCSVFLNDYNRPIKKKTNKTIGNQAFSYLIL